MNYSSVMLPSTCQNRQKISSASITRAYKPTNPMRRRAANIIDTVHQLRMKKARDAYIAELRGEYGVVVELSQPSAHVEVANAPRLGSENAPVQIVEFADYECPYCQKVNGDLNRMREQFGDQVSLVYKDFPLPMHPLAAQSRRGRALRGRARQILGVS